MATMTRYPYLFVHSRDYRKYDFGEGHAFRPFREELTSDLLDRAGLLPAGALWAPPAPATDEELALFHESEFIQAVKEAGRGAPLLSHRIFGLGTHDNPVFAGMHEAAAARAGGSLQAVRAVMRGERAHAANFGGGLHHALPRRASGFCIYNDIGVAIAWLRKEYDARVAYIDLDVHHGDGVQWGFYDDPQVLTFSIHESGRHLFPGTGELDEIGEGRARGTSVNIPLEPGTDGDNWLACLETALPDILAAFRPDILITQHGCDTHRLDPLAHLNVDVQALEEAARLCRRLAHEICGGRWVALGGGGYAAWEVVPRAWGLVWTALAGLNVPGPGELPASWIEAWSPQAPVKLPSRWYDEAGGAAAKDAFDVEREWRNRENLERAASARATALRYLRPGRRP